MRSARVATPEIAVALGSASGRLVNISATGALVRTGEASALGATCSLVLDTADAGVTLTVRIVRVEPTAADAETAAQITGQYLVGVVFTDCSASARRAIATLCGPAFQS